MSDDSKRTGWHRVDPATAKRLAESTAGPGHVFPIGSNALPDQLRALPGTVSYFVSSYIQGAPLGPGVTAGGEYAVVRFEGDTGKAYNYPFATSSDGQVYFTGPYKGLPSHHFAASSAVPLESLFGNPLTKSKP